MKQTSSSMPPPSSRFPQEHEQWPRGSDHLFTCWAFTISLHSLWTLPMVIVRQGGLAFLLIYAILVALLGAPLLLLELALGQYSAQPLQLLATGFWSYSCLNDNKKYPQGWSQVNLLSREWNPSGAVQLDCDFNVQCSQYFQDCWSFDDEWLAKYVFASNISACMLCITETSWHAWEGKVEFYTFWATVIMSCDMQGIAKRPDKDNVLLCWTTL